MNNEEIKIIVKEIEKKTALARKKTLDFDKDLKVIVIMDANKMDGRKIVHSGAIMKLELLNLLLKDIESKLNEIEFDDVDGG